MIGFGGTLSEKSRACLWFRDADPAIASIWIAVMHGLDSIMQICALDPVLAREGTKPSPTRPPCTAQGSSVQIRLIAPDQRC
jgi:hypothetical protein